MGGLLDGSYKIRKPIAVVERNDTNGKITPIALCFVDEQDIEHFIKIRVLKCVPDADIKSGTVGERYECIIRGKREYLYYGLLQPRSWFKVENVSEEVYNTYYKLPERANRQ
jgi:hypothetical protein